MDSDERLTALKKAYADIILNTAKEAAARIMVSERKALRFQRELYVAKEEAVQMLLRLKHMMDSKISEAATASLSQQKKIEELEAQLQEAEDIVNELREELREVQTELERATNNKEQQNIASPNEISEEKRFCTSQSIITQDPPESHQYESLAFSTVTTSNPNEDNKCYNLELPSIILRSKEPEPYRNGCTQRICACERNEIQEDEEEIEKICTPSTCEGEDDKSNVEKYEETRLTSWQQVRSAKSLTRKRKKASRYNRKKKTPSSRNYQDKKMDQTNYVSCTDTNASLVKTAEEVPPQVRPTGVSLEEKNESDAKNTNINNGERLSLSTESLGVPVDEKADVALVKSKAEEAVPIKPANDRIIKYQRKRKRDILNNSEGNGTIGKVPLKRKTVEKTNVSLETQKSSLVPESSRDSRRLAQVARQLISLSEKKW